MKIIMSPAKKIITSDDSGIACTVPLFQKQSQELLSVLSKMDADELQSIYKCSGKTFQPVYQQLCAWKEGHLPAATPAILSYSGIAFQYMAPHVFTKDMWTYANDHLRILSALYGVLKPTDGIIPYRLEMQHKIPFSLYEYWSDSLARALEDDVIICLASKEYAKAISDFRPVIQVRFFEEDATGKRKEKGVYAKMARGAMMRWMAEFQIESPEDMARFNRLDYQFDKQASTPDEYVFYRKEVPA